MRFIKSLFILSIAGIMTANAEKKSFTLDDLIPGGKTSGQFRPESLKGTSFWGDTFVYQKGDSILSDPRALRSADLPIITLENLNKALEKQGMKPLKGLPAFSYAKDQTQTVAYFFAEQKALSYDFAKNEIVETIPYEAGDNSFDFNATRSAIAVNNGSRLFIIDRGGNRKEVSTNDPGDIVWGQSVHRNEFGIHKGTFWSPKGEKLAFYRMDETMVKTYPLVNVLARQGELQNIKYPMAGLKSHEVTLGVYDLKNDKTVYLKTGATMNRSEKEPKDDYLTNIAWTPDQKQILIAELNRDQNKMDLNAYDATTGDFIKTLITETSDKYVEPEHPAQFLNETGKQFIWLSDRDGFKHIYLYDMNGKQLKQLTSGEWVVKDVVKIDDKGENIFYVSNEGNPIGQQLYRVNVKSGKRTRLTREGGTHYTRLNASGTAFYDHYTSLKNPGKAELVKVANQKGFTLLEAADPYAEYAMPEIELGSLKSADGKSDLYYRLTKPVNFDPARKYPVIVYLYNGPHSQMVTDNWQGGIRGWDIYMAQKGYVIFTIDGRGTDYRGADFEQAIHGKLGEQEGKDQMKGIEFLKSHPWVDANRIGIHGWSYGGFMTTYMMLTYPETFKVGVAGGPVIDWKLYEVMYGERYMGHPDKNKAGYEYSNLLNKAENLQGRLLMIHGDMDPVVVMQHSLLFLQKSVEKRVYPDYFIYPGHEHNVRGEDRVHLHEKITRYFEDYL